MKYTATQWDTAEDKAKFVNHFIKFVRAGFPKSKFNKKFYQRLSNTFGHIAHYNINGFWDTFFTTIEGKVRFLEITLNSPCYGDPAYTYCDAEKEIQRILKEENALELCRAILVVERDNKEYSEYMRLKQKFENSPPVDMDHTVIHDHYKGIVHIGKDTYLAKQ